MSNIHCLGALLKISKPSDQLYVCTKVLQCGPAVTPVTLKLRLAGSDISIETGDESIVRFFFSWKNTLLMLFQAIICILQTLIASEVSNWRNLENTVIPQNQLSFIF